MFDYRYHALSLAAVLFALALGVLIGVAIGDSNLVSSAKSGIVHDLESEISAAHDQLADQQGRVASEEAFANGLYPLAVHGLLGHRSVGLVFLGGSSERIDGLVHDAVTEAGGQVPSVVAVSEPLNLDGIEQDAAGTHFQNLAASPETLERFGYVVGRQLVSGGRRVDGELLSRVRSSLLSSFDGQLSHLDGVVVVRAEPAHMSAPQSEASTSFDTGLLAGIARRPCHGGGGADELHRALADLLVQGQGALERGRPRHRCGPDGARLRARRPARNLRLELDRRLAAADRDGPRPGALSCVRGRG